MNGSISRITSAELYDPAANVWTPAGSLTTGRSDHTATLLPNGKVLLAAGSASSPASSYYSIASAELYDPATNTWAAAGSLAKTRSGHTATMLPNGYVLVAGGSGDYLAITELYGPATVSGAPLFTRANPGNAQATVFFTAPANNGGSPITGYTVTSNPAGGIDTNAGTIGLVDPTRGVSHIVTGLVNGTAYTFTVTATNAVGISTASSASYPITPNLVPSPPAIGTAIAGDAQATVTFTAPAGNGGSAITGYKVTSIPAGGHDSNAGGTSLSHVVTGLVNGTAYTFTVTAANGAGTGIASAASNSVTPLVPVGAPPQPAPPAIPQMPVTIGNVNLPPIFNLSGGNGPVLTGNLVALVSSALNVQLSYLEQNGTGSVVLSGFNGGHIAFLPLAFQSGDPRPNGVYPAGNGQYVLVNNGLSLIMAPALVHLDQLAALLPGVIATLNDNGSITASLNGITYVVQPDFAVQLREATGTAQLITESDGSLRFTDAAGNSQLLAPAFLEPVTARGILQSLDLGSVLLIQENGTAAIVLNGQTYTLVPDLTLGSEMPESAGQGWWQEGPNRYRVRNLQLPGTTQGFTVR